MHFLLLRAPCPVSRASLHTGVLKVRQIFKWYLYSHLLPYDSSSTAADAITSTEMSWTIALVTLPWAGVLCKLLHLGFQRWGWQRCSAQVWTRDSWHTHNSLILALKFWEKNIWCFSFPLHPMLCFVTSALLLFLQNVSAVDSCAGSAAWLRHTSRVPRWEVISNSGHLEHLSVKMLVLIIL